MISTNDGPTRAFLSADYSGRDTHVQSTESGMQATTQATTLCVFAGSRRSFPLASHRGSEQETRRQRHRRVRTERHRPGAGYAANLSRRVLQQRDETKKYSVFFCVSEPCVCARACYIVASSRPPHRFPLPCRTRMRAANEAEDSVPRTNISPCFTGKDGRCYRAQKRSCSSSKRSRRGRVSNCRIVGGSTSHPQHSFLVLYPASRHLPHRFGGKRPRGAGNCGGGQRYEHAAAAALQGGGGEGTSSLGVGATPAAVRQAEKKRRETLRIFRVAKKHAHAGRSDGRNLNFPPKPPLPKKSAQPGDFEFTRTQPLHYYCCANAIHGEHQPASMGYFPLQPDRNATPGLPRSVRSLSGGAVHPEFLSAGGSQAESMSSILSGGRCAIHVHTASSSFGGVFSIRRLATCGRRRPKFRFACLKLWGGPAGGGGDYNGGDTAREVGRTCCFMMDVE